MMLAEFATRVITLPEEEENTMRKTLIGLTALGGILAMTAYGAQAAPGYYGAPHYEGRHATHADYYWHHRHWDHRRWEHHHWDYY